MVSGGHYYTTGLMRYMKDEWAAKMGGELPDADKWRISGAVEGAPQQKNGFDCGVFAFIFVDFISRERPLSFRQFIMKLRNYL